MFRSLISRPRAVRALTAATVPRRFASHVPSLSTYNVSSSVAAPLTAEEQHQADHEALNQAKLNLYIAGFLVGGALLVNYWYKRELDHFTHHRHQQEPYSFFIKRDDAVAAGFWPGRSCQFFEFNCYAATYDAADQLLREKSGDAADAHVHVNKH